MFWSMHSGIIAAIAVVFATYVGRFVALGPIGIRAVAITGIVVLSAINYVGVRHGSRLQTAFTVGKVVAILGIVVVGFTLAPAHPPDATTVPATVLPTVRDFALAVAAGLFAFGGWHMVTYAAGETVHPERTIPRALLFGTLIVTLCYVALNAVYFHVLPVETVGSSQRVAADAAQAVLGPGAADAVSGLVVCSTFGALSASCLPDRGCTTPWRRTACCSAGWAPCTHDTKRPIARSCSRDFGRRSSSRRARIARSSRAWSTPSGSSSG
jgi:APA family basic amino acid/polyamine antiporter